MRKMFLAFPIVLSIWLMGCNEVEKTSSSKPYSVAIKKERSYYQAKKIVEHLKDINIDAYVVEVGGEENHWYYVASGAFVDSELAKDYAKELLDDLNIKTDTILDYNSLTEEEKMSLSEGTPPVEEKHFIPAEEPDVPVVILNTIAKVPQTNAFYVSKMGLINFSQGNYGGLPVADMNFDFPRGIGIKFLSEYGDAYAEVILKDNVFGDRVTFDILHLKEGENGYQICSKAADAILATDEYEEERKEPITINAYKKLDGYVATILTKPKNNVSGKRRSYYILTDISDEYLFIVQSVEKDEASLERLIAEIGKSRGLSEYSEFWNSFYLIPKNLNGDIFLGYSSSIIGWDYARDRGYEKWAKMNVGMWDYKMYFYALSKGIWTYSVRDLITRDRSQTSYNLFLKLRESSEKTSVCGTRGAKMSFLGRLAEISFSVDRYILYLNPLSNARGNFTLNDLVSRAERFQYVCD